jgi:hypothetical protein
MPEWSLEVDQKLNWVKDKWLEVLAPKAEAVSSTFTSDVEAELNRRFHHCKE